MLATSTKSLKTLVPAGTRLAQASMRSGGAGSLQQLQVLQSASISTWDRVRSSMWHPVATVEQSLMDVERMTSQLFSRKNMLPFSNLMPRVPRMDDDDFFKDLEVSSPKEAPQPKPDSKQQVQAQPEEATQDVEPGSAYSSYSFSSSTVLDKEGHRVTTVRRRYEDSTGRLKALHEREIDGKKLKKVWNRKSPDDKGEHHTITHGASAEEFEEEWKHTPFGEAEEHDEKHKAVSAGGKEEAHKQVGGAGTEQKKNEEHQQRSREMQQKQDQSTSAFGADYGSVDAVPDKERGKEAHGVTKEAQTTSREEAIAQASKTQEEETTPPHYSS